jgi:outer membrane protein TolC
MARGTRAQLQRRMAQSRRALRHRWHVPPAAADRPLGPEATPASEADAHAQAGRPLTDAEHQGVLEHDVDRHTKRPPKDG